MAQQPGWHGSESLGGPKPVYFHPDKMTAQQRYNQSQIEESKAQDKARMEAESSRPQPKMASPKPTHYADGAPVIPGVQRPMMHNAVSQNNRQFGTVQQGLQNTLKRLRTANRLSKMLRKTR